MIRIFISSLFFLSSSLFGEVDISVIIPCYHGHFWHLEGLLTELTYQTFLPDEVVIALSESHLVDQEEIDRLQAQDWPFFLKLIQTTDRRYSGTNRNIACENAEGRLLILQDADDIPHFQRIEIIKSFFDEYQPEHLLHSYDCDSDDFPLRERYSYEDIPVQWVYSWAEMNQCGPAHHGNIALTRSVFERIRWNDKKRGADVDFNILCIQTFQKTLVVKVSLLNYRQRYSSWDNK